LKCYKEKQVGNYYQLDETEEIKLQLFYNMENKTASIISID